MTAHLPPPHVWRAAQSRARACGLWLDMTADGVFHVYRLSDGQELSSRDDWAGALELLRRTETARERAYEQMEMAL